MADNSTDSLFINQPGPKVSLAFKTKDTNRGNPYGNQVDNTSGTVTDSQTSTQKMGKRGTMGPSVKLPSGKLYQNT